MAHNVNNDNKSISTLHHCCAKVFYDMESLGIQPGAEDWVRDPESIKELERLVKYVWITECHGDPSEWPWNQYYIMHTFIRERKKNRKHKDGMRTSIDSGTLFQVESGTIYFMRNTRNHIKIGWTGGDPVRRLAELQTGESEPITLLAKMKGTERQEKSLHVRFAAYRTGGGTEWFHSSDGLQKYIKDNAECLRSI